MFESLPQGDKISISKSVATAFERYMKKINWDENKYSFDDFVEEWKLYSEGNASWFKNIDEKIKAHTQFHNQLTAKMNEVIEKIITTPPTDLQINEIDALIHHLNRKDVDYCCKAEAKFLIDKLKSQL